MGDGKKEKKIRIGNRSAASEKGLCRAKSWVEVLTHFNDRARFVAHFQLRQALRLNDSLEQSRNQIKRIKCLHVLFDLIISKREKSVHSTSASANM